MTTVHSLRTYQWGKETTRGTAVPATSKIAVQEIDFEPDDQIYRPRLARGLAVRNVGNETPVKRNSMFSVPETPVIYDQLQNWLSMSVKGGVVGVGTAPVLWTYARSLTADPAPTSWTLERRITDGSTPIDNEWAYCLLSKIGFKGAQDEPVMFSADGFGRRIQASTLTAAKVMPTIEIPTSALTKLYIDSTFATLGTTLVSGQVLGYSVDFTTGLIPFSTLDARSDQDFTVYKWNESIVALDVEITCLVGAQYALEKTAAEAGTLRAVRIQSTGSSARDLKLDMMLKHELGSSYKVGEQDGQDIVVFKLQESADDDANLFQVILANLVTTII